MKQLLLCSFLIAAVLQLVKPEDCTPHLSWTTYHRKFPSNIKHSHRVPGPFTVEECMELCVGEYDDAFKCGAIVISHFSNWACWIFPEYDYLYWDSYEDIYVITGRDDAGNPTWTRHPNKELTEYVEPLYIPGRNLPVEECKSACADHPDCRMLTHEVNPSDSYCGFYSAVHEMRDTYTYAELSRECIPKVPEECMNCMFKLNKVGKCDPPPQPNKKNGQVARCGPYGLTQRYWDECGQPGEDYETCTKQLECSTTCVQSYLAEATWLEAGKEQPTCEQYAAAHAALLEYPAGLKKTFVEKVQKCAAA